MANYARELNLCCLPLRKKYRSYIEIIALMLEAMKYNGVSRFSILKYTSTNSSQLKKFLESLIEMGFVEMDIKGNSVLYRASEKGLAFLGQYYILQEMLLSTRVRNKPTNVVYASNGQQHPTTLFATRFARRR